MKPDPIAAARANWGRAGWGEVADGMVAVTSVMRAHQIMLARVENVPAFSIMHCRDGRAVQAR